MARPKSEDKRNAILAAAVALFAERGVWSTPTSAISKAAGVAEGTLFTYFATKEILVNEVYRTLKLEMAAVLMATFPRDAAVRTQFEHVWTGYLRWGAKNRDKMKVMSQLHVSDQITDESRVVGSAPFAELEQVAAESGHLTDYPLPFIAALMESLAETTMQFVAQSRSRAEADKYCRDGFEVFWNGVTRR